MTKNSIKFDEKGLVPAIIQDVNTKQVLMLGYVSEESINKTFETGQVWFYSRSKNRLWLKGEVSQNFLNLKAVHVDCDQDTLLISVDPDGPVCHNGTKTCFDKQPLSHDFQENNSKLADNDNTKQILEQLVCLISERKIQKPKNSYVSSLFELGIDRISQKVIEEAGEVAIAAINRDKDNVIAETSDLIFHLMVLLVESGVDLEDIWTELSRRKK
ncbi:MAG: bifunctional phosphoribosyl-AMP cyclohydrolase/phosphoribosyl-ATP diphosphatase HisIE [Dehalococcoidia bacterium]